MHKQHFHEVPSTGGLEARCPIHCISNTTLRYFHKLIGTCKFITKLVTGEIADFIWFCCTHSDITKKKKKKNPNLSDTMEVH